MEHVAILKKSSKLLDLIVSGEKTIESRWYIAKYPPWNRIKTQERIYFKNSGDPVNVQAKVVKVMQFSDLDEVKVKKILDEYGTRIGIPAHKQDSFFQKVKAKKYCILIFLENVLAVEPFLIDKKGFGMMAAWLCVDNVTHIRSKI